MSASQKTGLNKAHAPAMVRAVLTGVRLREANARWAETKISSFCGIVDNPLRRSDAAYFCFGLARHGTDASDWRSS